MRVTLLTLGCLLFQAVSAQQEEITLPLSKTDTVSRPFNALIIPNEPQAQLMHTLPNGNKVYALPQDNMPCVVPNVPPTMPVTGGQRTSGLFNYNMPVMGLRKTPLIPGTPVNPMITPQVQIEPHSPVSVPPFRRITPNPKKKMVLPKP